MICDLSCRRSQCNSGVADAVAAGNRLHTGSRNIKEKHSSITPSRGELVGQKTFPMADSSSALHRGQRSSGSLLQDSDRLVLIII
ncbi:hypothetical protein EYF80_016154 [Liparis tanakae]|uniref:Uncharacterized protein n=1 Tax=Liparis tanakae TaxID=230148 RepID=A0A4Z2I678_9TELE|nr:hypothetical protein EYF80_016154 [Liparis tanakae]